MPNPERPKPIEKQRELYKLPRKEINWAELPSGTGEIETSLDRALRKILTPPNFEKLSEDEQERVEREVSLQIAAIEAKAVRAGFDTSFARRGDKVMLRNGALYLDLKREKKAYAVKLDKSATVLSEYQEIKPEAVVKSRRAWEQLKEALEHGVVSEILTALAGGDRRAGAFENRKRIWKEVLGQSEAFRGTAKQNRAIVDYVKAALAAGRTPDIAPRPAPEKAKKERREKEKGVPTGDAYMRHIREHPLPPEAPNALNEARHKMDVLLGPRLDEINAKEDELEELMKRVKINYGGAADAKMVRGSIYAALHKAGEARNKIHQFSQDVAVQQRALEELEKGALNKVDQERIARSKTALAETKAAVDDKERTAANIQKELLEYVKRTQIKRSE